MVVELKLLLQKKGRKGLAFYIEMSRYRIFESFRYTMIIRDEDKAVD